MKGTAVFANATVFDGMDLDGCGTCDCCHDYISDCDACVNSKCLANATSGDYYACSMYVHQGKVDNQRHKPVPSCYRHTAKDGPGSMASPNIVGASPIAASSPVRALEGLGGSSSKSGMSPRNRADVGRGGKPRAKKLKKNKQIVLPKIHDGILARLQDLREFMQSEEQRGRVNGGASPLWWPIF